MAAPPSHTTPSGEDLQLGQLPSVHWPSSPQARPVSAPVHSELPGTQRFGSGTQPATPSTT